MKDSRGRDFYPHSPLCTIDGYIMETRFWRQVREILDFREVLKFKNIKKNCNGYLSKSSRKIKKCQVRTLHLRICAINFTAPFAMSIIGLFIHCLDVHQDKLNAPAPNTCYAKSRFTALKTLTRRLT